MFSTRRTRVLSVLSAILFAIPFANSQNLVLNGDFEKNSHVPDELGAVDGVVSYVSTPNKGSADYFNVDAKGKNAAPRNFRGFQQPKNGNGYMGIYMYAGKSYTEYVQLKFEETLEAGKEYTFAFHVSLSEDSQFAVKQVSALFTRKKMNFDDSNNISLRRVSDKYGSYKFENLKSHGSLSNKKGWTKVSLTFVADGFEKYVTIGNFGKTPKEYLRQLDGSGLKGGQIAYYYIDDATLFINEPLNIEYNKAMVMDKVKFDPNSHSLTKESKEYLRKFFFSIADPKRHQLTLKGHTDNDGSSFYNYQLSKKRVVAVANYLKDLGMPNENIKTEAYGEKQPLYKGFDPLSKQQNRRVEFVITEFDALNP
ncbi:OmpA family protein [Croceivirga radicis]|uniref:OmpA family protein n=1 Tax=Croceivirga radicis TaxID=1929488 RepID=UPI0009B209B4|nr:OmpA family protein [Croceivirga radicis]